MDEVDCEEETLRRVIKEAIEKCEDVVLLDLIYKILIQA